jgi:hypothetical protein
MKGTGNWVIAGKQKNPFAPRRIMLQGEFL